MKLQYKQLNNLIESKVRKILKEQNVPLDANPNSPIDLNKLIRYSLGIVICCNGEYGQVFYNPLKEHIFVCLGDSNPYGDQLEWYLYDAVRRDWDIHEGDFQITIENEATPNNEIEEGWYIFNDKDAFIPYKD